MKGLTPLERQLMQTIARMQTEAAEREQRLTQQISSLTWRLNELGDNQQRLMIVCDRLAKLLAPA